MIKADTDRFALIPESGSAIGGSPDIHVDSGQVASGITLQGGKIVVENGGLNENGTVQNWGVSAQVNAGGVNSNITAEGGGVITILDGGRNIGGTALSAGIINVFSGAINSAATVMDGARIYVGPGGTDQDVIVDQGGHNFVDNGGVDSNATVNQGGWDEINGGATIHGGTVMPGGTLNVNDGGTVSGDVYVMSGGTVTIFPNAGGTFHLESDDNKAVTVSGIDVQPGATVTVDTVFSNFDGDDHWTGSGWEGPADGIHLAGVKGADVTGITFANDGKAVPYPDTNDDPSDEVIIHLKNGGAITLHIPDAAKIGGHIEIDPNGDVIYEPNGCFLERTRILTPDGYQPVESLKVGDSVVAVDPLTGEKHIRKIVWTGNRAAHVNLHHSVIDLGDDERGYSVCIKKGAFTRLFKAGLYPACCDSILDGTEEISIPSRDLYVTAEHCFLFRDLHSGENKFLPIRMLVNGESIFYDHNILSYTYYHLETDAHCVIVAEGALSESYLDTGDRNHFTHMITSADPNGEVILSQQFAEGFSDSSLEAQERLYRREKGWKRAVAMLDTQRAFAEGLWRFLAQKQISSSPRSSQQDGHSVSADLMKDIYLSCSGKKYHPSHCRGNFVCFMIDSQIILRAVGLDLMPDGNLAPRDKAEERENIYLCSPAKRPCDIEGVFVDDRRRLGLLVGRVTFAPGTEYLKAHLSAGSENLSGWNNLEPVALRWTKGKARLSFCDDRSKIMRMLDEAGLQQKKIILAIEIIENMPAKFSPSIVNRPMFAKS